jgi:hypothetical protein
MNEFIWDGMMNQFEFGDAGLVRALRDVPKGTVCYIAYGEDYDWDKLKITLAHELASTLVAGSELFGHPDHTPLVASIAVEILGWTCACLPLKRVGSGLERLIMAVIDDNIPESLVHSVHPSALTHDGVLEPVGRWVERFLCSSVIISRLAFRRANDPRVETLPLGSCMTLTAAGQRVSPRGVKRLNYGEALGEDFPPLPGPTAGKRGAVPVPVVELTRHNDPMNGRVSTLGPDGFSSDELEMMVEGDNAVEWLGGIQASVGEWTLSLAVPKDDPGRVVMNKLLDLARDPIDAGGRIGVISSDNYRFQRRLSPVAVGWYGLLPDDGWSGWVMLEWFDRQTRVSAAERLVLTRPRDRAWLAVYLESLLRGGLMV